MKRIPVTLVGNYQTLEDPRMQLYVDPITVNSRKVIAGFKLLGIDYEQIHVDYFKGEQKSAKFKAINPMASLPALVDGDFILWESNAILTYAADKYEREELYPKEIQRRADINRWLLWESSSWFPCCYVYLVENCVKPLLGQEADEPALKSQDQVFHKLAAILEERLSSSKWLCGDKPTIADIAVAAPLHLHPYQKLPLLAYPNLKRWMQDGIECLPAWQDTYVGPGFSLKRESETDATSYNDEVLSYVESTVNYTTPSDKPLDYYFYEPKSTKALNSPGSDARRVKIYDAWPKAQGFTLDKEGFALREFKGIFSCFDDELAIKNQFYEEVISFVKAHTGASRVVVFDHTVRKRMPADLKVQTDIKRPAVQLVHSDYTEKSAPQRVRDVLPNEAAKLLEGRVAFFNVWRPICDVVQELPLAMCDASTTSNEDLLRMDLKYTDRTGEIYVMRHSPEHRWYYFPLMTPRHALLLKTYDSVADGRARFMGHTAFEDPSTPADAIPRVSIEVRTMAFFD